MQMVINTQAASGSWFRLPLLQIFGMWKATKIYVVDRYKHVKSSKTFLIFGTEYNSVQLCHFLKRQRGTALKKLHQSAPLA